VWESRKSPGLFKEARESITLPRAFSLTSDPAQN
jgi:hypothetical protein